MRKCLKNGVNLLVDGKLSRGDLYLENGALMVRGTDPIVHPEMHHIDMKILAHKSEEERGYVNFYPDPSEQIIFSIQFLNEVCKINPDLDLKSSCRISVVGIIH
jgi:hypothetical protein